MTVSCRTPHVEVAFASIRIPANLEDGLGAIDMTFNQADLAEIGRIVAAAVPAGGQTRKE